MSDSKSKAEKLAEGKKKLKKFQSKHKGKPADHHVEPEATDSEPGTVPEDVMPTAANLFPVADQNQPQSLLSSFENVPVAPVPTLEQNIQHVQAYQSQTMENFNQLAQKFGNLESELGQSLVDPTPTLNSVEILESQVHELTRKLNEERQNNQSLEARLREQYSNVDELTLKLQQVQVGSVSMVQTELGPLKDQLDNQIRTVALLVGEKAELGASLSIAEAALKNKELENEELQAKLSANRHQVQKLKEELATLKKSHERFDSSNQNLCTEVETTRDELKALRRTNDDLREEILELRRKLELREIDFNALQSSHKEKLEEIDRLHLRVTQLVGAEDDPLLRDRAVEANAQQKIALEAQIQELLSQVERANMDRDTAATHYQNYVQQLNKEREGWIVKVQEVTKERDELQRRDQELVSHIGELEKQMQLQRAAQAKAKEPEEGVPKDTHEDNADELEARVGKLTNDLEVLEGKLTEERENVHKMSELLRSREEQLESLQNEMERLRQCHIDPQQISATLESEKVAASRAMSQNQQLRAQLEEMQTAFVQMTNDKANLMTELESERYLSREIRSKHTTWEEELKSLREKLHFKDEEMIRLTHESGEQEKKILMLQQELDQMRHLEVNTRNHSHLQTEIVRQREQIAKLQALIQSKETEVKALEGDSDGAIVPENGGLEVSMAEEVDEGQVALGSDSQSGPDASEEPLQPELIEVHELPTGEAMIKLQERFTRTMAEIAELTEEKQRLEHLVIQLQGETETIGEYIALYQSQRKLLRQREIEKDIQVQKITADREEMKEKLLKLNALVEQMLAQRNIKVQEGGLVNGDTAPSTSTSSSIPELAPALNGEAPDSTIPSNASRETAEQILDLLTEIKTQNTNFLTDTLPATCSCCSGQLITV